MSDMIALERAYGARNYDPLPVVLSRGEGRLALGRPGPALPRHAVGLFGRELRLRASAPRRRAHAAGAAPGGHLARLLQRPPAALPEEALRSDGNGSRASHDHRRRGRRDRDQVRAQVGLLGQGNSREQGANHRLRRQLPRPHFHDRGVFIGGAVSRGLRSPMRTASMRSRSATRAPWKPPSGRTPPRSSSSPSRARPASSSRPKATSPKRFASAARATSS
jgi:hypothetical protein